MTASSRPMTSLELDGSQGGLRELISLAYPIVLTQLSMSAMQIVDSVLVGRLGPAELGAVGFGGIWLWTALTLFVGSAQGVQTFVAQDFGAGRSRATGAWFWQGLYAILPMTLVCIGAFAFWLPDLLERLGPPQELRPLTTAYVQARAWGSPAGVAFAIGAAFFRGLGDTRTPLFITVVAVGVNALMDYGLIFGHFGMPALGVSGAGFATAIANWVAGLLLFGALVRRDARRSYGTLLARPSLPSMRRFLRTSAPVGAQWLLGMSSFAAFSTLVAHMGSTSIAALFTDDAELLEAGASLMLVGAVLQIFDTQVNIAGGSLRGAGDTRWPLVVTTGLAWAFYLPLAYLLGITLGGGLVGAWTACVVNSGLAALILLARFKRGRWREIVI